MPFLKQLLSMGVLDPNESARAKRVARFFDYVMLFVMLWLPLQWYMELQKQYRQNLV